ncbi:MAG: DUF2155 domain-containing protein [Deltaproteobacteria bacterium]|nr:DUF2155 domain-containing protein [Deltaproteobacteria bacterium]
MIVAVAASACNKKEEASPTHAVSAKPEPVNATGTVRETSIEAKPVETVVVPDNVKTKFKDVKIDVLSRQDNKKTVVNVPIGGASTVSGMTITVKNFLPDFKMEDGKITSASNELNNPAAYITVAEGGKEIYAGWFFANHPSMNRFDHPNFEVTLAGHGK